MDDKNIVDFWHSVEGVLNARAAEELLDLVSSLALHYSDKTKRIMALPGTMSYVLEHYDPFSGERKTSVIKLIPFFGTNVGYNSALDVMVISAPR